MACQSCWTFSAYWGIFGKGAVPGSLPQCLKHPLARFVHTIEVDTKTKGVQWRAATELRMEDRRQDSPHRRYDMTTLAVPWTWNTS